jgi:hypothetical protein
MVLDLLEDAVGVDGVAEAGVADVGIDRLGRY